MADGLLPPTSAGAWLVTEPACCLWSKAVANPLIRSLTQVARHAHDRLVVLWRYTHGAGHALGREPSSRI